MTTTAVSQWEAMRTDETRAIEELLSRENFERVDAYRFNSASIRIRIIDPRFDGLRLEARHALVDPILERLPESTQGDILTLLIFTPAELLQSPRSFRGWSQNYEFEEPSESLLRG